MPPQLIVRPQSGIRKAEQFTPELKWQSRVLRLILQADLRLRGKNCGICELARGHPGPDSGWIAHCGRQYGDELRYMVAQLELGCHPICSVA